MTCDYCQKNEATNVLKQTVNGTTKLLHICDSCANSMLFSNLFSDFSIHNLLSQGLQPEYSKKVCSKCGCSFDEIMSTGKMGCDQCYEVFRGDLSNSIEKMHGKSAHAGKVPASASGKMQRKQLLETYKTQLNQLIVEQEFEKAAEIRDKIKELEQVPQEELPQEEEGDQQ